jgi:hypothetical protein
MSDMKGQEISENDVEDHIFRDITFCELFGHVQSSRSHPEGCSRPYQEGP